MVCCRLRESWPILSHLLSRAATSAGINRTRRPRRLQALAIGVVAPSAKPGDYGNNADRYRNHERPAQINRHTFHRPEKVEAAEKEAD